MLPKLLVFSLSVFSIFWLDANCILLSFPKVLIKNSPLNAITITHAAIFTQKTAIQDTTDPDYANYFIVVADTGSQYYSLRQKMFLVHKKLNIPIDTLGRFYNRKKNLIALPDNDTDEIYAGGYFPRRYPSESLSLEYLNVYQKESGDKTIALVAGIYETEKRAKKALTNLRKVQRNAFLVKSKIYIGCIH